MSVHSYHKVMAVCVGSMRTDWGDWDDLDTLREELFR
jgi:hypothetical protein